LYKNHLNKIFLKKFLLCNFAMKVPNRNRIYFLVFFLGLPKKMLFFISALSSVVERRSPKPDAVGSSPTGRVF